MAPSRYIQGAKPAHVAAGHLHRLAVRRRKLSLRRLETSMGCKGRRDSEALRAQRRRALSILAAYTAPTTVAACQSAHREFRFRRRRSCPQRRGPHWSPYSSRPRATALAFRRRRSCNPPQPPRGRFRLHLQPSDNQEQASYPRSRRTHRPLVLQCLGTSTVPCRGLRSGVAPAASTRRGSGPPLRSASPISPRKNCTTQGDRPFRPEAESRAPHVSCLSWDCRSWTV